MRAKAQTRSEAKAAAFVQFAEMGEKKKERREENLPPPERLKKHQTTFRGNRKENGWERWHPCRHERESAKKAW